MPTMTLILVVTCALLLTSADAQAPGTGSIPASILEFIQTITGRSSSGAGNSPQGPQLSLVESFGPIGSSTLDSGTQANNNPFLTPQDRAAPTLDQLQAANTSQQQSSSSRNSSSTSSNSNRSSGSTQHNSGASVAKFFGGGSSQSGSSGSGSTNSVSGGPGLPPGSVPLGNDILSKVVALVNQVSPYTTSGGTGNTAPSAGMEKQLGLSPTVHTADLSGGLGGGGGEPAMAGVSMGTDPLGSISPIMSPVLMPSVLMTPLRNRAMLTVGQKLGQKLGVNQYYEIHGCADPTLLFSGQQKILATLAMAQGCHSIQAMHVCQMAQIKERMGHSLMTSRVLPPQIRSHLEGCLSAKVLLNPGGPSNPLGMMSSMTSSGAPSLQECGMLLATVMDGGSLDPESMISTRRSVLPWSCNESSMGPNNIPYRCAALGKCWSRHFKKPTSYEG